MQHPDDFWYKYDYMHIAKSSSLTYSSRVHDNKFVNNTVLQYQCFETNSKYPECGRQCLMSLRSEYISTHKLNTDQKHWRRQTSIKAHPAKFFQSLLCHSGTHSGGIKRWCASDVCLSVAYIGPKSRTERSRKTKLGTEVAHVTRDSDNIFKVKRSKVNFQRAGHILAASHTACLCCCCTVTKLLTTLLSVQRGNEHWNLLPKTHRFLDIIFKFKECRDLENRVRVRQGHWKCHHSIEHIWLPINVP